MAIPEGINPDDLRYGYIPTLWICALFVALFALSTIIHLGQAVYFRMWWLLPTVVLAGIGEVIGWSGRLWSSKTYLADAENPFLMQITTTIIAPTPLLAANFVILGVLIRHFGLQYSRLSAKWYLIIFCSADIIALVVQAIGGASASSASREENGDPRTGGNIMLGGIVFQLLAIIVYICFSIEFYYRYYTDTPFPQRDSQRRGAFDLKTQLMVFGLSLSTLCIFIRAIYRTIELADGWSGRIIETEVYFNVLDGGMIVLAIYAINIFHPGLLLTYVTAKSPGNTDSFPGNHTPEKWKNGSNNVHVATRNTQDV